MKTSMLLLCSMLLATVSHAGEPQKIDSKVEKVIVFLSGAQVTRTATVNVAAGTSNITFQNLSADIDPQSIQVHAAGAFTILSVKHEINFLNGQTKVKRIEDLKAQQKTIRDKIELQNDILNIAKEEETMLSKNQVISGQNTNLDVLKLKQALDFQTERLTEIKKKEQGINNDIAMLNEEVGKIDRQIAEINKGITKFTSDIDVALSAKNAVQAPFAISYVVKNAGWYPSYDIRAKDVNSPINIAYKASVSQSCGEEWNNVKLVLSTGNPSVSGSKPQLNPYYLNFGMVYAGQAANITNVKGRVTDRNDGSALPGVSVTVKGTTIGCTTDVEGNYSIQIPAGNQTLLYRFIGYETQEKAVTSPSMNISLTLSARMLQEVVVTNSEQAIEGRVAGLSVGATDKIRIRGMASTIPIEVSQTENQTNMEFNIETPYTITSDGKQNSVEIGHYDLAAAFEYYTAPKLNADVFLTAQLVNWNQYNFLSGEANLFFEGTFIGKSLLDTKAANDTLNLSLGTDKSIIVTRTLQKNLTVRQIIGSNKKETKDWIIEIKNRKGQSVNLLVEDQVPVSQNTGIEVEKQELSGGKLTDTDGKIQWQLKLNPQDDKKLELRYQVKYPKNQQVIVQ